MERVNTDETKVSEKLHWELQIVTSLDRNSTKGGSFVSSGENSSYHLS